MSRTTLKWKIPDASGEVVPVELQVIDCKVYEPAVWLVKAWQNYESMNGQSVRLVADDLGAVRDYIGERFERDVKEPEAGLPATEMWYLDGGGLGANFGNLRVEEWPVTQSEEA